MSDPSCLEKKINVRKIKAELLKQCYEFKGGCLQIYGANRNGMQ